MVPRASDTDRPTDRPEATGMVSRIAARNRLSVEETTEMLDGFAAALDRAEALNDELADADELTDVDAPIPFTIVPGVIA